jgi:hypothetical protein
MAMGPDKAVDSASQAAREAKQDVQKLRDDVDNLKLITQAMWFLLKQKTELTDEALVAMIREVDGLDGKIDGRFVKVPEPCPQCARPVTVSTNMCVYCGIKVERKSPF